MATLIERLVGMSVADARCDQTYPPGTIGVVSADLARYSSFAMAMLGVKYPFGSTIAWQRGCDIVNSCNKLARGFEGDWLWLMGDDHVFDTNLLLRLLDRMYGDDGCDLVAPLVMGRQAPFPTVIGRVDEAARRIDVQPITSCKGLFQVDAVGTAGLLVRRRVFDAMLDPCFEAGSITRTGLGEDWWFCIKARRVGFRIWVDADLTMGHTTSMTVWPTATGVRLDLGSGYALNVDHTQLAEAA